MSASESTSRRILLVETNEDGTEGGSHRALRDLVRHLDRRRFEPEVLVYQPGRFLDLLRADGVTVHLWDEIRGDERRSMGRGTRFSRTRALFQAILRRRRFVQTRAIALVHGNNTPGRIADDWLPACRLARIPCASHARATVELGRGGPSAWLQRHLDAVVPVSDWVAMTASRAGIPAQRIHRVHDGVDVAALARESRRPPLEVRAELGLAPDDFVVLLAAHLRPWKGHRAALRAVAQMPRSLLGRLRLLFAGAAPAQRPDEATRLETEIRAAGLGAVIRCLGPRDDVFDLMRASDVVLHASTEPEPFGLVVIEAMALGRPIVASRLGGPAEIVTERSGILFDPDQPRSLAFLLTELSRHPDLTEILGKNARARALDFDISRTVEGVSACWGSLLGSGS